MVKNVRDFGTSTGSRLNVFISYSRRDLEFADQLVTVLEWQGFRAIIDRKGIHGAEKWEDRLGQLILEADIVVFVLSPDSAASEICAWEVDEATRRGKRIVPVICRPLEGRQPHQRLRDRNYIHFYTEPSYPGSGFGSGQLRLIEALSVDVEWLRDHTRLEDLAARWERAGRPADQLLRGSELVVFKIWRDRRPSNAPDLTPLQRAFIADSEQNEASRINAERKRIEEMAIANAEKAAALEREASARAEREAAQREAVDLARRESEQARKVTQRTKLGLAVTSVLTVAACVASYIAYVRAEQANAALERAHRARLATIAEQTGTEALRVFKLSEIDGLILALQAGRSLQDLAGSDVSFARGLDGLPALSPVSALIGTISEARIHDALKDPPVVSEGSSSPYITIKISSNGELLASVSASSANRIEIYSIASGQKLAEIQGEEREFTTFEFSSDSQQLVTGGYAKLQIFNARTGERGHTLSRDSGWFYVEASPDARIAAAAHSGKVRMWSLDTGTELDPIETRGPYSFSPDGRSIAIVTSPPDQPTEIAIFEVQSRKESLRLSSSSRPNELLFGEDGRRLYAFSGLELLSWDLASGRRTRLASNFTTSRSKLSYSKKFLARGGTSMGRVEIAELPGDKLIRSISRHEGGTAGGFQFHPSEDILMVSRIDGTVAAIQAENGGELFRIKSNHRYSDIKFTPDGTLFAAGGEDGSLKLWRMNPLRSPGVVVDDAKAAEMIERWQGVKQTAQRSEKHRLWRANSGALGGVDVASGTTILRLTNFLSGNLSADTEFLATTHSEETGRSSLRFWHVASQRMIADLEVPRGTESVYLSDDDNWLLALMGNVRPMMWPTKLQAWIDAGCALLKPYFTKYPERNVYTTLTVREQENRRPLCNATASETR